MCESESSKSERINLALRDDNYDLHILSQQCYQSFCLPSSLENGLGDPNVRSQIRNTRFRLPVVLVLAKVMVAPDGLGANLRSHIRNTGFGFRSHLGCGDSVAKKGIARVVADSA
jgi:hypothetical protein